MDPLTHIFRAPPLDLSPSPHPGSCFSPLCPTSTFSPSRSIKGSLQRFVSRSLSSLSGRRFLSLCSFYLRSFGCVPESSAIAHPFLFLCYSFCSPFAPPVAIYLLTVLSFSFFLCLRSGSNITNALLDWLGFKSAKQ